MGPARYDADSILRTMRESLMVLDPDLRVITANPAFLRTFQLQPDAVIGRLIYEVQDGEWNIPKLRSLLEDILPNESAFDGFEVDHHFWTVGRKVLVLNARRVKADEDAPESILLAMEDITERRRAEEDRQELETKFTSLVKNVRDHAIFAIDLQGKITSWNLAAQRILGYSEEEALGRHFSIIFTPEDQATKADLWEMDTAVKDGQAEDERWHARKGGEQFWALGIVTPTYDDKGGQTGYSKILRDMTDRKRAEQETQRLNTELTTLNAELTDRVRERTQELEAKSESLRQLAAELTQTENKQRRDIARMLHDHLQQLLVAAKMRVDLATSDARNQRLRAGLVEALAILDDSITATRSLSVDLDPPLLAGEGLPVALEWMAGRMQRQHGLSVRLEADEAADPADETSRQLLYQAAPTCGFGGRGHPARVGDIRKGRAVISWDASFIRLCMSPGMMRTPMPVGAGNGCRRKRNGSLRRAGLIGTTTGGRLLVADGKAESCQQGSEALLSRH